MVAWSLKCNVKSYIFMNLKFFKYECGTHISHVHIIRMPISYSRCVCSDISSIYHFYRTTKVIGQQKRDFTISKNHIKKESLKKDFFPSAPHNRLVLSLHFV